MRWGPDSVLEDTLSRAKQAQLELTPLESLQDVDDWDDLLAAAKQLSSLADYLQQAGLLH